MIKVELFYKVTLPGSTLMMTEVEYKEFRESAINLPLANFYPSITDIAKMSPLSKYNVDPSMLEKAKSNITQGRIENKDNPNIVLDLEKVSYELSRKIEEIVDAAAVADSAFTQTTCKEGECRLELPEDGPETVLSEDGAEGSIKPVNIKKSRKKERDYSKYIDMKCSGKAKKDILRSIADDFNVSIQSAENYYYQHVNNAVTKGAGQVFIDTPKKKLSPLEEDIASMSYYHTQQQFKDACAAADIGRGKYNVSRLKEIYLETHPNVRW